MNPAHGYGTRAACVVWLVLAVAGTAPGADPPVPGIVPAPKIVHALKGTFRFDPARVALRLAVRDTDALKVPVPILVRVAGPLTVMAPVAALSAAVPFTVRVVLTVAP